MNPIYTIEKGVVSRYETKKRQRTFRLPYKLIITLVIFIVTSFLTKIVFDKTMDNNSDLEDTISLGAIFATFGSAIVSVFSIYMSNKYDRFNNNLEALGIMEPTAKWKRWSFIKRRINHVLYNGKLTYQELVNAKAIFDVGSHPIEIYIPTVLEDFDDIPIWSSYFTMRKEAKDYEQNALKKDNRLDSNALLVWDCLYDMLETIIKYKISSIAITIGSCFIIWSIIYSFLYLYIPGGK